MGNDEDREGRVEKLVELFELLDRDNSGAIDVEEMRILGKIISQDQSMPSVEETIEQLKMADKDDNMEIDLAEWLDFSENFFVIPRKAFDNMMEAYINQVKDSFLPDGERYTDENVAKLVQLPVPLCARRPSEKNLEDESQTNCSPSQSPSKTFARNRGLSVKVTPREDGERAHQVPTVLRSPAGWFWGTCSNISCPNPAKISCIKCNITFCSNHGTSHLLDHMKNAAEGLEAGDSPDKTAREQLNLISRVDSRFGFFPDALEDKVIDSVAGRERQITGDEEFETECDMTHTFDETTDVEPFNNENAADIVVKPSSCCTCCTM